MARASTAVGFGNGDSVQVPGQKAINGGHGAISEHHSLSGHLGSRLVSQFKPSARLSTVLGLRGGKSTQVPGQNGENGRHREFALHHKPLGHSGS